MQKHLWWAWAIKNSVCMICWTALAIIFDKWWIALFGLLFISLIESTSIKSHSIYCDECGKVGPSGNCVDEARKKAKEAGWIHVASNNTDYCPDCLMKVLMKKGDTK